MTTPNLPASIARANGRDVTTRCTMGGIGTGLLIQGFVFVSLGNGFYGPMADLDAYVEDNGRGYMAVIRSLDTHLLDDAAWVRCEALDAIRADLA